MSGSLSGIPLSQQFDNNGKLLIGALLYIYAANTTTPQNMFQDSGLTVLHPWPLPTDTNGRIPMFYLADGSVHVRLTDSGGVILYDNPSVLVIGPSSGGGGGGGVDPNAILSTGDLKWRPTSESLAGWVRGNGRTIGSATSGGTERANADTSALFTWLWTNFADAICPVSGGRGGSSAADFAANKTITLIDMRGRSPFGVDDMGAAAAGRMTGATFATGNSTTPASVGGEASHTLLTGESGQKAITAAPVTVTDPGHIHADNANPFGVNFYAIGNGGPPDGLARKAGSGAGAQNSWNVASAVTGITAALTVAGSSAAGAHNTMPPFMNGTWYLRL
jgi:hypothetical protein